MEKLPQSSVAVHVLDILPNPQMSKLGSSTKFTVGLSSQLSVAVATPAAPITQSNAMSGGHVITGAVISCTNIVCSQLLLLPQPSVAVHVLTTL